MVKANTIYRFARHGLLLTIVLIIASCSQSILDGIGHSQYEIVASLEEMEGSTRVSYDFNGRVMWTPGDSISVFSFLGENKPFVTQDRALTAHFSGELDGEPICALYPFDKNASLSENTLSFRLPQNADYATCPAVAMIKDNKATFMNVCGRLSLHLQGTHPFSTVVLHSLDGTHLCGTFSVDLSGDYVAEYVSDGADSLVFNLRDGLGSDAVTVPFIVPVGSLKQGFKISITDDQGRRAVYSTQKEQEINRSQYRMMPPIFIDPRRKPTDDWPSLIDLGLSFKWATANLGADTPLEAGDFYAWGELETKDVYDFASYKFSGSGNARDVYTKYVTMSSAGSVDRKNSLDPEDDVATQKLGSHWRIPTASDYVLTSRNTKQLATSNFLGTGIPGIVIISTVPGFEDNYFFIPASGIKSGTTISGANKPYITLASNYEGNCLYNTVVSGTVSFTGTSFQTDGSSQGAFMNRLVRYLGVPVRPIYEGD